MSATGEREQGSWASGFGIVLLATAIGGAAGYLITWLVPRGMGFAEYAPFAAFWAFLFLLVSALSGIQQEVTRATGPASDRTGDSRPLIRLAAAIAAGVLVLILGTAPIWQGLAFPEHGWSLVVPLAVGCASYVWVAVVYGSLYGIRRWRLLFWLISTEALLRLAVILVTLAFTTDLVALAWAAAAPIPVALLALLLPVFRTLRGATRLDVGPRRLGWNFARTIAASTSLGVLVSGLPLLIDLTSRSEPPAEIGLFVSAMTLTRAPLIVVALALQSYFIVLFQASGDRLLRVLARFGGVVVLAGAVLAAAAYLVGPTVFGLLFPGEALPSNLLIAGLVGSAVLVALLCLAGPAVLSRSLHVAYSIGWVAAAVATIGCLVLPADFATRSALALSIGPVAGLVVHLSALLAARKTSGTVSNADAVQ